ncbi:hypothetical protein EOD73_00430 [Inhella crocodyli]|uniref:Uncharacterized protein n=2 Tax=Inhella crocodyli TaxID=2499851 RepID=A0A3S2UH03_9BURK|nr:hypothetical protein EOD73_00430 [Inhella crocodyli]
MVFPPFLRLKFGVDLGSMVPMVHLLPSAPYAHDVAGAAWFDERLDGLFDGLAGLGGLSTGARLDDLQRFARLMQTQGQGVEATRMLYDMPYARAALDEALLTPCAPLQQMAHRLNDQYERAGQWLGLGVFTA